ncbi:MAG: cation:proton antiporter [Actinobacteria bacterium]|nr:MAG: cation:proton antiporter [Actinomycetota bacterium]
MVPIDFTNLLIVAAAAFAAPLALGLVPVLRLPAVVLEIVLGVVLGPSVLGWARVDEPVQLMSLLGLAFLLLLAGLEVEFEQFRGRLLKLTGLAFAASIGIALVFALGLHGAGLVKSPLLIAIIASATSLGVVIPVLKDAGESSTHFGQVVLAGASIADVATIILLSLFFSGAVLRLQDTTAQIRVRGAFALLVGFVVLAEKFGLEAILGAFMAGAILKLVDRDQAMTHTHFHQKLAEAGFGIFVPFFFVASGLKFDGSALFAKSSTLALVPIFVALLLAARALPALLYRPLLDGRHIAAAGLLQATSLGFIVVAGQIGMDLGLITKGTGAAFVAAGLVSVLVFPLTALSLLRGETAPQTVAASL